MSIDLPEPKASRVLIACQIERMFGAETTETWADRTYEFKRCADGLWVLDLGYGTEARYTWAEAVHWLRSMRPRNVELIEE